MSSAIFRRLGRRVTAMGAGAALVAAGLSLGVMAPANAASVVTIGVTDALGNPVSGNLKSYRRDSAGVFQPSSTYYVSNTGFFQQTISDGVYKFAFVTETYTEFYKDKTDLATADVVTVAGGTPVTSTWTVDQPYVVGSVTNAAGKPLAGASIAMWDAASGDSVGDTFYADAKGVFKAPSQSAPVKLGFYDDGYAFEYYNDKGNFETADPVAPSPTQADLGRVVLTAGGTISGQVTSDAGAPLEFVRVTADGVYDYTDKNGVYTIKNVTMGNRRVRFSDPIGEYSAEYYNNTPDYSAATLVPVGADQAVGGINANLTPLPADTTKTVEVSGTVKDSSGVPVVGAYVTANSTPAYDGDRRSVEGVYSNRQGVYAFTELEKVQGENQFKVHASSNEQGDDNAFDLFGSWFGGMQNHETSPVVTVTPGTPVGAVDFVLDRAGGIAGSVTGAAGTALVADVDVYGANDGLLATDGVTFKADSTFESRSLRPGTYKIRFDDIAGLHAGEWWKDKYEVDDAVVVTVKAGQMTGGLNAALGTQLIATERPEIEGYPWVGKAITADSGVWNLQTGTDFNYEWFVGSTVVGKGDAFTPSAAHIGDRLTLRVTAENGRLINSASSAPSVKIGYQPKIKVKVKGSKASLKIKASPVKAKKVKGTVIVKEIVKVNDNGTVKYKKVAKTKIKKGKGTVSLSKLKKGKHKLVFFFTGKGKVGSNEEAKKVKVKR
ncbi:carboxypeptidase-like regulatory domain-containing protein [Nocardioides allogilvus]|uniref:carboxypeptidase-like regulatory domain-containing protein n=1 Tax=Nocardioides allogilvus TaxID=2072017 RepID=UPI0013009E6E|nr:carboxypeptidase-like regulatory domain-containing protein [Nocardioides allogilvus]